MMRKLGKRITFLFALMLGIFCIPGICRAEGESEMTPIYGKDIKDGSYEVEMESSSSMFRIVKARLTAAEEKMTVEMTLSGTGYLKLFMGTGEEALKSGEENFIPYVEDAEGAYTYTIPVEALDQEFDCAAYSKRKQKWYDRKLMVLASSLPKEAFSEDILSVTQSDNTQDDNVKAGNSQDGSVGAGNSRDDSVEAGSSQDGNVGAGNSQDDNVEAGSSQDADAQDFVSSEPDTVTESAKVENLDLKPVEMQEKDGDYTMEVTLNGGTGRASVVSPAQISISEGKAAAFIEWSSPDFDYMIVNGTQYFPVNKGGNSVFEIPVLALDAEMDVIADTVAMSKPHEIAYTLVFHSDTLQKAQERNGASAVVPLCIIAMLIAAAVCEYAWKRRH